MHKKVIIIGAGGHGKVIADIVINAGDELLGFLDDDSEKTSLAGFPVLGSIADASRWPDAYFVVAIGEPAVRERIAESMPWAKWYTAIHSSAIVSNLETTIGEGSMIMAGTIVSPGVTIGRHCILNTGAIVEHNTVLEDYVHVSVAAKTGGEVFIGKSTWVGIGASVNNCISICPDCMLGAGAVVVKNITDPGVYCGVPARKLR
ncbi:MAG: acetyltransferase [Oscillospiraceae bacterium]|nr:acetyltransferase [Oscillospiraceae bacterium]